MIEGARVQWAGTQSPFCAPGFSGMVERVSYKDENSIRVLWDEGMHFGYEAKERYTWERRANLRITEEPEAALVLA